MTALRPERDSGTAGDQGSSYGQPYGDSGAFGGGRYEESAAGEENRPPLLDDETLARSGVPRPERPKDAPDLAKEALPRGRPSMIRQDGADSGPDTGPGRGGAGNAVSATICFCPHIY